MTMLVLGRKPPFPSDTPYLPAFIGVSVLTKEITLSMSVYASIPLMPVFSKSPPSANRVGAGCVTTDGLLTGQ